VTFGTEILEWCDYPIVTKILKIFIRFDRVHKRDRRTYRQTSHDSIDRACIASRGKNWRRSSPVFFWKRFSNASMSTTESKHGMRQWRTSCLWWMVKLSWLINGKGVDQGNSAKYRKQQAREGWAKWIRASAHLQDNKNNFLATLKQLYFCFVALVRTP